MSSNPSLKTFRQLLASCDSFPPLHSKEAKDLLADTYVFTHSEAGETYKLGYTSHLVIAAIRALPPNLNSYFTINTAERTVSLTATTLEDRTLAFAAVAKYWFDKETFPYINKKWRSEQIPVYAPSAKLFATIERSAAPIFGFVSYYVFLAGYRYVENEEKKKELKLWVQLRSDTKISLPGSLDMVAAGAMTAGQDPQESITREAFEEASLPRSVMARATRLGNMELSLNSADLGNGHYLYRPGCGFGFEVELGEEEIPRVNDGEVEDFYLMGVDEVKLRLQEGMFAHSSKNVIEWLMSKGELTLEAEDVVRHERRVLEFPLIEAYTQA